MPFPYASLAECIEQTTLQLMEVAAAALITAKIKGADPYLTELYSVRWVRKRALEDLSNVRESAEAICAKALADAGMAIGIPLLSNLLENQPSCLQSFVPNGRSGGAVKIWRRA